MTEIIKTLAYLLNPKCETFIHNLQASLALFNAVTVTLPITRYPINLIHLNYLSLEGMKPDVLYSFFYKMR
jgi:hypothetical protein